MNPQYLPLLCALLFTSVTSPVIAALDNTVKNHPTPYLAMHGSDPVLWQQWNAQTLQRARQENKLLFVSVGFFSCYWCHVMQRESFRDAQIAQLLNEAFIPVIVDRELDPALDAQLLQFVERFRGSAGWPLNVFITPQGYPLLGGIYFPRDELLAVMSRLSTRWNSAPEELNTLAKNAAAEPELQVAPALPPVTPNTALIWQTELVTQALQFADPLSGGFGEQSKFPMSSQLLALLAIYDGKRADNVKLGEFLQLTLERMAGLGLRDHLSGGFFRYTTDPTWHTPHFEKMLYDNAMLATVYLRAARVFKRDDFTHIAHETLDFMLARLRAPQGMFYSSLSSVDEQGVEGAYYLWDTATLGQVLNAEERTVARFVWHMNGAAPLEHGYLPLPDRTPEQAATLLKLPLEQVLRHLKSAQTKLLAAREQRKLPVDTKIIAGWNGLTLLALSEAAAGPEGQEYAQPAQQLRDTLIATLVRNDVLLRVNTPEANAVPAALEDYAYLAAGLLHYAARVKSKEDFTLVRKLVNRAWQRFYHKSGWVLSDNVLLPTGAAGFDLIKDGALPSASAILVGASLQLAEKFNDAGLRRRALNALARGQRMMPSKAFDYASHVSLAKKVVK